MWRFLLVLVLGSGAGGAEAIDAEERLAASVGEQIGRLSISGGHRDAGLVQQGQELLFEYPYEVEGGPVMILGVHQECGCLTQSLKPGQILPDGQKGVFTIRADTSQFVGSFGKTVTILTNQEGVRGLSFPIKAQIERTLSIKPPLVEMNRGGSKLPQTATVKIQGASKQRLHIEKVAYNEDTFDVDFRPVADAWELKITWKGEASDRPRFETIEVTTNGSVKNLKIPVVLSKSSH